MVFVRCKDTTFLGYMQMFWLFFCVFTEKSIILVRIYMRALYARRTQIGSKAAQNQRISSARVPRKSFLYDFRG